jgi:hypothetical protein
MKRYDYASSITLNINYQNVNVLTDDLRVNYICLIFITRRFKNVVIVK